MTASHVRPSRSNAWLLLLPCALAAYLALATAQIELPGLNYDEALDAVPAMQFVLGQPLDTYSVVRLLGQEWPLMVMPYIGCTTTYLLIGAFALFGPSLVTLRITMIALGALTLVAAWGMVLTLFDRRVAGVATMLLAVSPAFVFWTRMGAFIALPVVPLSMGVVWGLARWRKTGNGAHLVLAAWCFGVGLATKILFIWLLAPLVLAAGWLVWRQRFGSRDWVGLLQMTRRRTLVLAGSAALVGVGPLLAYNVLHAGGTLRLLQRNLVETELYGVRNLALLANLRTRFANDLVEVLNGAWLVYPLGGLEVSHVVVPALCLALLVIAALAHMRRLAHPRRAAFAVMFILAVTAQSAITVSSLIPSQLAILWPWPQTLIAVAAVGLVDLATERQRSCWPILALGGLLALAPLASDMHTVLAYHARMAQTGGQGHSSDAIFALAADLDQPDAPQAVALDWGFKRNLQLLTQNRVVPEDGFTFSQNPGQEYRRWAEWRLEQGPALYIAHTPAHTAFHGHLEQFEEAAYRTRRVLTLWREYSQRNGLPVYRVYAVSPAPPLAELPSEAIVLPARFGDQISLLGHDPLATEWRAGERVVFHVYWRAEAPIQADYKVFVHLSDTQDRVLAQHDGVPMLWAHPTSAWQPGEIVADRIVLMLPTDLAPERYRLWIGVYREDDGTRVSAAQDGVPLAADRLLLSEVQVTPQR